MNPSNRGCSTAATDCARRAADPEAADLASIARQHRATQRLADLGVPVAPPLAGHDGRTVAVIGGHAYALHPWIDGRHRHGGQLTLNDFWMLRWHYERGDTRADAQFPAASALAVWWTRAYDTVCQAFTC